MDHIIKSARTGLVALILAVLGSGCTMTDHTSANDITALSPANTAPFGPRPDIATPEAIHRLTPAQEQAFLAYMDSPNLAGLEPGMRLYQYMERMTRDFKYEGTTNEAARTLAGVGGNCMSLAVLTTALADAAGLDIDYQLMDDVPVYEFNGTTVKKGIHIRTKLYNEAVLDVDGAYLLTRPGMIIDYFPTNRQRFIGNITREKYLAMYYQNLAVEALDQHDLNAAYWLALEALSHEPLDASAINALAITKRRAGDAATAEFIYRFGIERAEDKLSLMKNYALLLTEAGRDEEAAQLQARLSTMADPSPFHWYQLAQAAFERREYRDAIRFYNKALDLAPYLHEAWLGIAQANYAMGRLDRTQRALQSAVAEAEKVSTRDLYQAKLAALAQQSTPNQ